MRKYGKTWENMRKYGKIWKNVGKYDRPGQPTDDNIIRRMRFACWITKATNVHSEYVTHYFSTAVVVKLTRLCVMLYVRVHCLTCCL
jgi:hypothetical protein